MHPSRPSDAFPPHFNKTTYLPTCRLKTSPLSLRNHPIKPNGRSKFKSVLRRQPHRLVITYQKKVRLSTLRGVPFSNPTRSEMPQWLENKSFLVKLSKWSERVVFKMAVSLARFGLRSIVNLEKQAALVSVATVQNQFKVSNIVYLLFCKLVIAT